MALHHTPDPMGGLGAWEIALIFLAILLIFGAKRIPEIARGLGKGIREFKDATQDIKREIETADPSRQVPQQTQYQPQPYTPPQAQPQPTAAPPADQMAPPQPTAAPPTEGQAPSA